jgi:hypothetical protein
MTTSGQLKIFITDDMRFSCSSPELSIFSLRRVRPRLPPPPFRLRGRRRDSRLSLPRSSAVRTRFPPPAHPGGGVREPGRRTFSHFECPARPGTRSRIGSRTAWLRSHRTDPACKSGFPTRGAKFMLVGWSSSGVELPHSNRTILIGWNHWPLLEVNSNESTAGSHLDRIHRLVRASALRRRCGSPSRWSWSTRPQRRS